MPEVKPVAPALPAKPSPRYGIDDAIKLMRTLPVDDNVDLVVRVIKRTLESLSVRVSDIVEDAHRRQEALKTGISEHQAAIQQLEREIETRRAEIAHLEDELAETTTVRERLQLAENLQASLPPKVGLTPQAPTVAKKPEAPLPGRSAPPLPTTFRPKLSNTDMKKILSSPPTETPSPGTTTSDDDTAEPVQSSDLLEKTP
jgi:hypothetical protein